MNKGYRSIVGVGVLLLLLFLPVSCGNSSGDESESSLTTQAVQYAENRNDEVPKPATGSGKGYFLGLYRETYQGAFTLLLPKGWKTEGGMVPSGVAWNVVDLVENNIKFRASSPDGKSFFGWYPRFYFQDPEISRQSSMGMIQKQNGEVLNGTWLYPYMDIETYVRTIVFGWFSGSEFQNPQILGGVQQAPELAPWIPKNVTRYQAGYVNFETEINGVPSYGRIYTIIYDIQNLLWTTVGTWGLVAPKTRWPEDERLMEFCIRSFRLDPGWVERASRAQAQRGQQYNDVIRTMNGIDQEIQRNRARTNSDIMHENYKTLTGQIETRDPSTGEVKYLPSYNNAYTDGQGNYFLRDYDDGTLPFDNASQWRKLDVVNRLSRDFR